MAGKSSRFLSVGLALVAVSFLCSAQSETVADRAKLQEKKIAERLARMKADSNNPFFAASSLPLAEQNALAEKHVEAIKKLAQAEPPDGAQIVEHCLEILRKAPASPMAQMANWNVHSYFLMAEDRAGAQSALESYLAKYKASESQKIEAYDKLAMIAAKSGDWGLALYYADQYLALNPSSYALMLTKARGLIKEGDAAAGEKLLQKIIAEAPGSVQAALAQGDLNTLRTDALPPDLVAKYKESLRRLRQVVMAVETFRMTKETLPSSLAALVPEYLPSPVEEDAWGNKLIVEIDLKNNTYRIASAGSDGRFSGFGQKGEYSDLAGKDIIFADGAPVFTPQIDD